MLHFPTFLAFFNQRTIRLDPCYRCFKDSIKKKKKFCLNIHKTGIKDLFNNLNKFLTNLPIFFCFKYFREIWAFIVLSIKFWSFFYKKANLIWCGSALFSLRRSLVKKQGRNFDFWSKQVFWSKDNTVWPVLSFIIILLIFTKNFLFDFIAVYWHILFQR